MSNALQLRDASDVTTFIKQRAIIQNYRQLDAKDLTPIGGIPHEDLMAVSRYGATYIPRASLLSTVVSTLSGGQTLVYQTSQIAATPCITCSGSSYQPLMFTKYFRQ